MSEPLWLLGAGYNPCTTESLRSRGGFNRLTRRGSFTRQIFLRGLYQLAVLARRRRASEPLHGGGLSINKTCSEWRLVKMDNPNLAVDFLSQPFWAIADQGLQRRHHVIRSDPHGPDIVAQGLVSERTVSRYQGALSWFKPAERGDMPGDDGAAPRGFF